MDTYVIANGGCGERLTSIMMTLYQCGFYGYADPIKGILIIDNDSQNPAHVRLTNIVKSINNMNHVIGRDKAPILGNDVVPPIQMTTWPPKIGSAQALGHLLSTNTELEALSLISTEDELKQTIDGKGYAGHVNIGVTLVNTALEMQRESNSSQLYNFLDHACPKQGGQGARFIIIGSTHGGTGAALNTAIAERIRDYYRGHPAIIEIFGLFMLSYYSIPDSKPGQAGTEGDRIHIDPNQFRPADIEALGGYRGMHLINPENPVFDNILFCGYDPRPLTNTQHKEGGNEQDNKFSIPELLMCSGANFIFKGDAPRNEYLAINLQSQFDGTIRWNNVPYGGDLKKCLGGMGLFACSLTEGRQDAAWNRVLTDKISRGFSGLYFMRKTSSSEEFPLFEGNRNSACNFLSFFWNILYQITTTVNGVLDKQVNLFKSSAFVGHPMVNGFWWVTDNLLDATIIDFGDAFDEGTVPSMSAFNANLMEALKENVGIIKTENPVEVRIMAYFAALFKASYNTYGSVNNNG